MDAFRLAKNSLSNDFMTTDIRVIKYSNVGFLWDGDDGGASEA